MPTQPTTFPTAEQYLEIERAAEYKSEYYDGEMFAMAGAREAHNLIVTNAVIQLGQQLRSRPCRAYSNGMRVQVTASRRYSYPDLVVVCGEPQFLDGRRDTLLNPTLIVEVLSPTTELFDRGRKSAYYRDLKSLADYLLISSERVGVELYTRQSDGRWLLTAIDRLEDTLDIPSIDCRLALADLYEKVEFETPYSGSANR